MNLKQKKIIYSLLGTILGATALAQAIEKNYLAIFPLIGSIAFYMSAWRTKNK